MIEEFKFLRKNENYDTMDSIIKKWFDELSSTGFNENEGFDVLRRQQSLILKTLNKITNNETI